MSGKVSLKYCERHPTFVVVLVQFNENNTAYVTLSLIVWKFIHNVLFQQDSKMAKEDLLLPVEMGKLEIEPSRTSKHLKDENPFTSKAQPKVCHNKKNYLINLKCSCSLQKNHNHVTICKKKNNKIIKEPVLKILQSRSKHQNVTEETHSGLRTNSLNSDVLSLCALVDNCNQLRISSEVKNDKIVLSEANTSNKWWKNDLSHMRQTKKNALKSQAGTCSQQALNPPCDVTIDELASYFETLVHIPKKMSSMAEMMYI